MQEQDFPFPERAQADLIDVLKGSRRLSFAYAGPVLDGGRIDAIVLADGLKGEARLVNRVADIYLGPQNSLTLHVDAEPSKGSLEIFVSLGDALSYIGDSKILAGIAVVMGISGFSLRDVGRSLWGWFKKLKGRPITDETDLTGLFPDYLPVDRATLIRIYNDPEVQAAMRAALRPLRKEGIERFETRVDRAPVEIVTRAELQIADSAETEAIVADEVKSLDIQKASFVPHLSWHLSDEGKPFDAKIEDPALWEQVAAGDKFGSGDRLHVDLHTSAERETNGRLKITKTVTKVHKIERASGAQLDLFRDSSPEVPLNDGSGT